MCDVSPHVQCPARAIHAQVRVYVYINTNNPVQSGELIVRGTSRYDAAIPDVFRDRVKRSTRFYANEIEISPLN